MKEHFKLHRLDEAIIWRNESPVEPFLSREYLSAEMKACAAVVIGDISEIVVELKQPRGARCLYGLLGAKIHRSDSSQFALRVGDGLLETRPFNDSLLRQIETPRCGLPEGAAAHILHVLQEEMTGKQLLFGGSLEVCFGAHGDISSSIHIFKLLAGVLPKILFAESLSADFVAGIFAG